ncbi:MAG TPA: hypothetical protein VE242_01470, partial [Chthoniobacterales bacterium]|nr:hypothetical protein [Chthoniobacterales bacterium]
FLYVRPTLILNRTMNRPTSPPFLQEIANAFGAIEGVEAVAWCGSSAMGTADIHSDFDLYVYMHN